MASSLFLSILFGFASMAYLAYGKKQGRGVPMVCGGLLLVVPYFVENAWALGGIGLALIAAPFLIREG